MDIEPAHPRLLVGALAAIFATSGGLVATTSPAEALSAPSGLHAAYVATKGVGLQWKSVGDDAYRVRISTSSTMESNQDTWDVLGSSYEWIRTKASPNTMSPRLTPGETYYFQVKAITDDRNVSARDDLSSYSRTLKITLPKTGASELKPVGVKATRASATSMYVSWRSRGPGVDYVLRYTSNPRLSVVKWKSIKTDAEGGVVTGLKAGTKYYFRSRVIDSAGRGISDYSAASAAALAGSPSSRRLTMVSYNVHKASGTPTWDTRRKAVAANILARKPAVVALQEASPLRYGEVKQYDDLVGLLGPDYALVTRAGSSGSKLVHNKTRTSVVKAGTRALTTVGTATRYAVWAVLEDKQTDGRFFVINTHLEPGAPAAGTYNDARIKQAREVLALIDANAGNLPVVIAGDMNSSRTAEPNNGQYETFTRAGYVDPLDNEDASWAAGREASAEHTLDVEYNSFNGFEPEARRTSFPIGSVVDYVYTSPGIRVATWRTVVKLDTKGAFVGVIPSDHNLLALDLHLGKPVPK
ncbi:fibronectin type III domain-containing protein [Aeromicrobium sp.]|uniref:endonuclease/exonuclease/phosphatase family protein n=1 Tax=Aeromicrobium sp. TaxID=1871063 RepID=UPI0030BE5221